MENKLVGNDGTPETTKSIEEFIELGSTDEMTYNNFSIMAEIVGQEATVQFPENNIIYDYMKELKSKCVELEFTDEDFIEYRYNPKKFAYRIYGHAELYFVVLALNNMCSFKDFNKRKIKVLYRYDLNDLLNQIYSAESKYISKNRNKFKNN